MPQVEPQTKTVGYDQTRTNWFVGLASTATIIAVVSLIWHASQQSKKIDDTERTVSEMRLDMRQIATTMADIRISSAAAATNTKSIEREIQRNERRIERLERRLGMLRVPSPPDDDSPYRGGFE